MFTSRPNCSHRQKPGPPSTRLPTRPIQASDFLTTGRARKALRALYLGNQYLHSAYHGKQPPSPNLEEICATVISARRHRFPYPEVLVFATMKTSKEKAGESEVSITLADLAQSLNCTGVRTRMLPACLWHMLTRMDREWSPPASMMEAAKQQYSPPNRR